MPNQIINKKSGKKRKLNYLPKYLQCCVPTLIKARKFSYSLRGKFEIALAYATTIHKTQRSTIDHMRLLEAQTEGPQQEALTPQPKVTKAHFQFHEIQSTHYFHVLEDEILIQIFNFHEDKIKHNKETLKQMEHMSRDCPFVYEHPLGRLHDNENFLNNI